MLLPFVRELFAEVEQLPAFTRAASHLRESAGRISVTGLSPAAKALIVVLLRRTVERPFVLVVADNRAAEELLPVLRAFCELTGAADPDSVVSLPARDVLPFQNLSPHPEIQEERATALWKIATGRAAIVISPVTATTILLRSPEYYADLARVLRRGEIFDLEKLLEHLNTVGYTRDRCSGNAGPVRGSRRHSGRVLAGSGPSGAHRVFRRRNRVDAQVRSGEPAVFEPGG